MPNGMKASCIGASLLLVFMTLHRLCPCSVLNLHAHVLHGSRRLSSGIDFQTLLSHAQLIAVPRHQADTHTNSAQPHELVSLIAGSDNYSQVLEDPTIPMTTETQTRAHTQVLNELVVHV